MNKAILFICVLFQFQSYSQLTYIGATGIQRNLEFHDASGRPLPINDHSNIDGTPLLQSKWASGIIVLKSGETLSDSLVNYSLFDDKLFFKRNEKMYPVNYPVKEFLLTNPEDPDKMETHHFENGFPSINKNDSLTFYEILYPGKFISLLKWEHKKVKEVYNYGGPFQRIYFGEQDFFVFFQKQNKIIELGSRINSNVLRKKFPEYSNQIDTYNSTHKLNGKKDEDLIQLFSFLDSTNF